MTVSTGPIVHILRDGRPLCGFTEKVPAEWAAGHAWIYPDDLETTSAPKCPQCLRKQKEQQKAARNVGPSVDPDAPLYGNSDAWAYAANMKTGKPVPKPTVDPFIGSSGSAPPILSGKSEPDQITIDAINEQFKVMTADARWRPIQAAEVGNTLDELERTLNDRDPDVDVLDVLDEARELMTKLRTVQGRRQTGRGVYYDFKVTMLETAAQIISGFAAQDGRKIGPYIRGAHFGTPISLEELEKWDDPHHQEYNDLIDIEITDNGETGDGLWIAFVAHERPKKKDDKDHHTLFAIELTAAQAEILAETLQALTKLRTLDVRSRPR